MHHVLPSAAKTSPAVRALTGAGKAQFTGSYLNRLWTRKFVLGSLLQRYNPSRSALTSDSAEVEIDVAVLDAQRRLCDRWQLPAKPLDAVSESRILHLLARNACGEGLLSDEAIEELEAALRLLPSAPMPLHDARNMERLLQAMDYLLPGDNLRRVSYPGSLQYAAQAESLMEPYLRASLQRNGGDVFDCIRAFHSGPAYAIDSATTSEVDDAIGIDVDPHTQETYFTVYVSDATVYCPFDSQLEQTTARALVTTTYLPEGVYFMLPKPIVEAATLREDRPCRTFCIRFQIDENSGNLRNYSVHLAWLNKLRRITYDQVQEILTADLGTRDGGAPQERDTAFPPPPWLTREDTAAFLKIHAAAQVRFHTRMRRALARHTAVISSSLPDPLIKVEDRTVTTLTDQVISTQHARLAVAELMIAANEVCSRIAQAEKLPIPFRGTRPLSSDHEAARHFHEPLGVDVVASLDASHTFLAEGMQRSVRELSGVTRAMYSHLPMYHAGLDTTHYTHSTSPLRRYADMLVHHQLKVWLWGAHGGGGGGQRGVPQRNSRQGSIPLRGALFPGLPIPEYVMATLCSNISLRQEQAALLQDGSTRFWTLTFIQQQLREAAAARPAGGAEKRYMCLVGETKNITGAPSYARFNDAEQVVSSPEHSVCTWALLSRTDGRGKSTFPRTRCDAAVAQKPRFVSEIYIPELQFAHRVLHSRPDVVVGAVVECRVARVFPTQDVLELQVVGVHPGGDERLVEKLWLSGVVSHLDS